MMADAVLGAYALLNRATTPDQTREAALGLMHAAVGALSAIDGRKAAAEVCYRHGDAVVSLGPK